MPYKFIFILAILAILAQLSNVEAQLRQPRCQGWPARTGSQGRTGLLVVTPGGICFGAVMDKVRDDCTLLASRLAKAPREGSFHLDGLLDFTYSAGASMKGQDRIEIAMDWECRGVHSSNRAIINTLSSKDYSKMGGTAYSPPNGLGYDAK